MRSLLFLLLAPLLLAQNLAAAADPIAAAVDAHRAGTADRDTFLRDTFRALARQQNPEAALRRIDTLHAAEILPGLAQEIFAQWYATDPAAAETYALSFTPETAPANSVGLGVSLHLIELLRQHQKPLTLAWLSAPPADTQRLLTEHALPLYNGTPSFREALLPKLAEHRDDPAWRELQLLAARLYVTDNPIAAFRWAWATPETSPLRPDLLRVTWENLGSQFPRIGAQWFRTQAPAFLGPPPTADAAPAPLARIAVESFIAGLIQNRKQVYPADVLNEIAGSAYRPLLRTELLRQLAAGDPLLLQKVSRDLAP